MKRNTMQKPRGFSNFGFSTILIAFVMICIVTFSALALMTANSDYKLSKKVADRTSLYYLAEKKADRRLQKIDATLEEAYNKSSDRTTYYTLARRKLKATKLAIELTDASSSSLAIRYTIPIGNNQTLDVQLAVTYPPDSGGGYYELLRFETVTSIPESTQETLNVIGNE